MIIQGILQILILSFTKSVPFFASIKKVSKGLESLHLPTISPKMSQTQHLHILLIMGYTHLNIYQLNFNMLWLRYGRGGE